MNEEKKKENFFAAIKNSLQRKFKPIEYAKKQYFEKTGRRVDIENPILFSEKLFYLRFYVIPYSIELINSSGAENARQYIAKKGYATMLFPAVGLYNRFEDIPLKKLPSSFIMKCTHVPLEEIVPDKKNWDIEKSKKQFHKWLKMDYGKLTQTPHLSANKPMILVEENLGLASTGFKKYEINVFNDKAKTIRIEDERENATNSLLDKDSPVSPNDTFFKPLRNLDEELLKKMVKASEALAKNFLFARLTFVLVNKKAFLYSFSFTPSDEEVLENKAADFQLGQFLDIEKFLAKSTKK